MSAPSPVSQAFHEAFAQNFLPLLRRLGLSPVRPKHVKPGLLVAQAVRALDEQRRLEATVWCAGGSGDQLRFRFDVVGPQNGVECTRQIELPVPWTDASAPNPRSLDFSGGELRPQESVEQLERAIAFLAGGFAANAERLGAEVPELAAELASASKEAPWRAAAERAEALWTRRHVRGDVDDTERPATVVFVGAQLVSVDADGARLTFRFDTRSFDRAQPLFVSGWYRTPAQTRMATRLRSGARSWTFDLAGKLIAETP